MTSLIPWTRRAVRPTRLEPGFLSIFGDVDRLFEEMWPRAEGAPVLAGASDGLAFAPRLDVRDADGVVEISADLPGLSEKDFEVLSENGVLTIRGERRDEREQEDQGVRWAERTYGRFERTVRLPEGADLAKAEASYTNGVLTVKIPKSDEASKALKIAVRTS